MVIFEIKLKLLSTKANEYGTIQLFQVLDDKQFQYIFKLAEEHIQVTVWKYNVGI